MNHALTAALGSLLALSAVAPAARAPQEPAQQAFLRFEAASVDGVDVLVVDAGGWSIEHLEYDPIPDPHVEVLQALPVPDDELQWRVVVRDKQGRSAVSVVQQPSRENGGVVRVRIDDGPYNGAAPLAFELVAVKTRRARAPRNVLVVTIDSLRPDHMGCYGYERATSPNLDAFAREAVRYENAFSTSSFTPPSHASLLTSRPVGDHGLQEWGRLGDEQVTLAEVLSEYGYRTAASVNLRLLSDQALGQGFEARSEGDREARAIVDDALEVLRARDDRPFFLWLHLYDVHRPYGRVPGWADRFATHERPEVGDVALHYNLRPAELAERGLTAEDLRWIRDRYDAGIAYADAQLGPLLAELASERHRAETLVVITADHGEALLDHRERLFSHDPFLYSSVTHVPLLIRWPGRPEARGVEDELVSLIDVAPTVLDLIGAERPEEFQGLSLLPLLAGEALPRDAVLMECWGWQVRKALRTRERLLIADMRAGGVEHYDLTVDPGERHPRAAADERGRELERRLMEFVARAQAEPDQRELDPETLDLLRELGYIED